MSSCSCFQVIFFLPNAFMLSKRGWPPLWLKKTFCCCTCAIQPEVRYIRTTYRVFPGSLVPDRWSCGTKTLYTRVESRENTNTTLQRVADKLISLGNQRVESKYSRMIVYFRCLVVVLKGSCTRCVDVFGDRNELLTLCMTIRKQQQKTMNYSRILSLNIAAWIH